MRRPHTLLTEEIQHFHTFTLLLNPRSSAWFEALQFCGRSSRASAKSALVASIHLGFEGMGAAITSQLPAISTQSSADFEA